MFICGSLEPGKDGVGDYTLRLVEAIAGLGHQASCVAINDRHLSDNFCYTEAFSSPEHKSVQIYRFSSHVAWKHRLRELRRLAQLYEPDWISIQYVPYAFSKKGLSFRFTAGLRKILGAWNWHIMFHELWIGRKSGIKDMAISLTQEALIKSLIRTTAPQVVHTNTQHYQSLLRRNGTESEILSLHGNIPVKIPNNEASSPESNDWIFVFFGSLDVKWQPLPFFSLVEEARVISEKKSCRFICLGRIGDEGKSVWHSISSPSVRAQFPYFQFDALGEQSVGEVSAWLHSASFGISMAPIQWIGKSSSVAAMIEHGLPVIVPAYEVSSVKSAIVSVSFLHQLLFIDSQLPYALCRSRKFPPRENVTLTARALLDSLNHPRYLGVPS